jgi:transposase
MQSVVSCDVGIDVAARSLVVVLAVAGRPRARAATVTNDVQGWQALQALVREQGATPATTRLIMEATGAYWQGVATSLHQAGWIVYVASPASVRHYGQAQLRRAKTDAVDAALLIDYLDGVGPAPWAPPEAEIVALQLLVRQRDDLVAMRVQTRNRQHALAQLPAVPPAVRQQVESLLAILSEQIAQAEAMIRAQAQASVALAGQVARLQTITGVGLLTAAIVVAETRPLRGAATAREVVAYAGLDPAPYDSGTSVHGARHISKTGNARLRRAVYMAALSAARHNPVLRPFYQRLRARGKRPRVALVAVARKLLALMATLLIHGRDFDPAWQMRHAAAHQ